MEEGDSISNGETLFVSFNFNPRLFVNEVLNTVDDLLDEAFSFFLNEASEMLKTDGTDRSAELGKGVSYIHDLVRMKLFQRMQKWEEYCHRFCFNVPDGLSLPETNVSSGDDLSNLGALNDTEIDTELKSLRKQLALVGKESTELARELRTLEHESSSNSGSIEEALQFYKKNDTPQMFQELMNAAAELREEMGKLKRRKVNDFESKAADMSQVTNGSLPGKYMEDAVLGAAVQEILQFLDDIPSHK